MDLKELALLSSPPEQHWYYRAKKVMALRALRGFSPEEILDIGAGDGFFSQQFLEHSTARKATCVDPGYDRDRDEMHAGKSIAYRQRIVGSNADLILAMDVLEHVPDECELLRPYISASASGTRFLITVPAFRFLWSAHDVFVEHYRRYTLKQLERTLERAGLEVDRGYYFYAGVFPAAAALRLAERLRPPKAAHSQLKKHNPLVNALLYAICAAEQPISRFNRCFGLTAVAIAHKP